MARTKQTARKAAGAKAPRHALVIKIPPAPQPTRKSKKAKTTSPKTTPRDANDSSTTPTTEPLPIAVAQHSTHDRVRSSARYDDQFIPTNTTFSVLLHLRGRWGFEALRAMPSRRLRRLRRATSWCRYLSPTPRRQLHLPILPRAKGSQRRQGAQKRRELGCLYSEAIHGNNFPGVFFLHPPP
jgi:hypothetical protein